MIDTCRHKFKFGLLLASISWGYVDVKQLRVLKAVAERGSFSAAAEALSYTQPAISQQIAALEKTAGATLVDRTSRGVRLTDAGRAPSTTPRWCSRGSAAAEAELEAIAGVRGGRVRLASFPTASASLLPPALARFSERHPDVELNFPDTEPEDALQMLRAAELEVAVVFEFHGLTEPEAERLYGGSSCTRSRTRCTSRSRSGTRSPTSRVSASKTSPDETWIQEGDPRNACSRLQQAACVSAGFEPRVGFESRRLQRGPGPGRRRDGRVPAAELALANMREDIVVRSLGKSAPARKIARRHARRRLPLARDRGDARRSSRGGGGVRAALRYGGCRRLSA